MCSYLIHSLAADICQVWQKKRGSHALVNRNEAELCDGALWLRVRRLAHTDGGGVYLLAATTWGSRFTEPRMNLRSLVVRSQEITQRETFK